jgi:hypothetical protein
VACVVVGVVDMVEVWLAGDGPCKTQKRHLAQLGQQPFSGEHFTLALLIHHRRHAATLPSLQPKPNRFSSTLLRFCPTEDPRVYLQKDSDYQLLPPTTPPTPASTTTALQVCACRSHHATWCLDMDTGVFRQRVCLALCLAVRVLASNTTGRTAG